MAEPAELTEAASPARVIAHPVPEAIPEAGHEVSQRAEAGERWIARVLRGGALFSGTLFLGSLALEVLPDSERVDVLIDVLRKLAASVLLVTPMARLVVAGAALGLKGEWRYVFLTAGVLGLLALAVGAGLRA
jgi:hypothetical protein